MADETRFLILSLGGAGYAVPVSRVVEITAPRDIQRDKGLTEAFEGKVEYRNKLLPVLNVRKVLRLGGEGGSTMLVLRTAKGEVGFLVDAVIEIADSAAPSPMPRGVLDSAFPYYRGVLRHKNELVLVLNEDGMV